MSIEVRITRELNDYAPRAIGPFTVRQFICLVCAGVPSYIIIAFLRQFLPFDALIILCFIPASIAWAFGWFRPYGMNFEVFLKSVFISRFVSPATRKYRGKNRIEILVERMLSEEATELENLGKKGKKKQPAQPKKKYKRSPLAYK